MENVDNFEVQDNFEAQKAQYSNSKVRNSILERYKSNSNSNVHKYMIG